MKPQGSPNMMPEVLTYILLTSMVTVNLKALVSKSMVALTASVGKFYGFSSHELTNDPRVIAAFYL